MKSFLTSFGLMYFCAFAFGQNTVGLISYVPNQSYEGYNLIYPHNQPNVYLLDNCGEIVHIWEDEANWRPGNTAYLTEDGLLYKTKRDASVTQDRIFAGGGGAIVEIRDWENKLVWTYTLNDDKMRLHHDIAVTPDGTVLAIAWELKTTEECLAAGRDTSTLARNELWPDIIIEIDPKTDSIIWEWHAWDHLVQDFDSTKNNFGVIAEHPELIDVNYGRVDGHPDWMHANSIDYHVERDQILLSVPYFDEVWIIDHTTKPEEVSGSFGGFSNKGGDLMYRWGNPLAYNQGTVNDQELFFQHDAHWVDDFLDSTHPQYGKIAVFNNRFADDFSVVSLISPSWQMYEWLYKFENNNYLPEGVDFNISHPVEAADLWSTGLSSAQVLPNGNTLILSGREGYAFELTPGDDIVWEYVTPRLGTAPATQGDTLVTNDNLTFRMDRYPLDFDAFEGKTLEPMGWIELEPDETFCDQLLPINELLDEQKFTVFPNPVTSVLTVEWDGMMAADIELTNLIGQSIYAAQSMSGGRCYIDVSGAESGIYLLSIDNKYTRKVIVQN